MSETLSIRVDAETNRRLDALVRALRRLKSSLAAEAIAVYSKPNRGSLEKSMPASPTFIAVNRVPLACVELDEPLGKR